MIRLAPRTLADLKKPKTTTRGTGGVLAAALLLPLGACSSYSYSESEQVTEVVTFKEAGAFSRLIVDTKVGDISVVGDDSATNITAEITKVGKGSSPVAAQESLDAIEIILAPLADDPSAFLCTSDFPKHWSGHSYKVEWRITAPSVLALDLVGDVGDIDASEFTNGARVRTDVGDIVLVDILGGVDARSDVGDIEATVGGAIAMSSDVGDIELTVLDTGYGTTGPIDLNSDVGDIEVLIPAHTMGLLHATTDVGDVEIDLHELDSYDIRKQSKSGKSIVVMLNGRDDPSLEMHSEVGDVQVEVYKARR